jgi:hypothetical protein
MIIFKTDRDTLIFAESEVLGIPMSEKEEELSMEPEKKQDKGTDEELAAYEKLRQRVSKTFGELHDKINGESISQAINKATAEMKEVGGHSIEAITKASAALKKDIASTAEHIKPRVDDVTEGAKKQFDHWFDKGGALWNEITREAEHAYEFSRDKGLAFLSSIAKGLGEWSQSMGEKMDSSVKYKTGEITHGGEFVCTSCESKIHLKQPGRLPPCPKCSKTEFRRS